MNVPALSVSISKLSSTITLESSALLYSRFLIVTHYLNSMNTFLNLMARYFASTNDCKLTFYAKIIGKLEFRKANSRACGQSRLKLSNIIQQAHNSSFIFAYFMSPNFILIANYIDGFASLLELKRFNSLDIFFMILSMSERHLFYEYHQFLIVTTKTIFTEKYTEASLPIIQDNLLKK